MSQQAARTARVEARLTPEVLTLIKRAAHRQGRSVSDFMVQSAREAAQVAIERQELMMVSAETYDRIMNALAKPDPVRWDRSQKAYAKLIKESR